MCFENVSDKATLRRRFFFLESSVETCWLSSLLCLWTRILGEWTCTSLHTVTFVFFYATLGFKPFNVKPFSSSTICFSAFLQNADFILALFSKSKSPVLLFVICICILYFLHLASITELFITDNKIILSRRGVHPGRLILCPLIKLYITVKFRK